MQDTGWVAAFAKQNRSIKGRVFALDPATGSFVEAGTSAPVTFHRSAVSRAGGQAVVVRGRQDRPKLSPVAIRIQAANEVTTQYRHISWQVQQLAAVDPVVAAGQVHCHQIFLAGLTREQFLPPGDLARQRDPQGIVDVWVEVMSWHDHSLHDLLSTRPAGAFDTVAVALENILPLMRSLSRCHAAGLIHRDIDAHNIMSSADGVLLLTDWGAATILTDNTTRTTNTVGKLHMLPPELTGTIRGNAQWYNDSWNLGYVLCQILLGRDQHPVLRPHARRYDLPPLGSVPAPVRAVVEQLLAHDPASRLTPGAAADALEGWVTQERAKAHKAETQLALKAEQKAAREARLGDRRTRRRERSVMLRRRMAARMRRRPPLATVPFAFIVLIICVIGLVKVTGSGSDDVSPPTPTGDPVLRYPETVDEAARADMIEEQSELAEQVDDTFVYPITAASSTLMDISRVDGQYTATVKVGEIAPQDARDLDERTEFDIQPLPGSDVSFDLSLLEPSIYLAMKYGAADVWTFIPAKNDPRSWQPKPLAGVTSSFPDTERPTASFPLPSEGIDPTLPYPALFGGLIMIAEVEGDQSDGVSQLAAIFASLSDQVPVTIGTD